VGYCEHYNETMHGTTAASTSTVKSICNDSIIEDNYCLTVSLLVKTGPISVFKQISSQLSHYFIYSSTFIYTIYEDVSKSFQTESITKYILTTRNTH